MAPRTQKITFSACRCGVYLTLVFLSQVGDWTKAEEQAQMRNVRRSDHRTFLSSLSLSA